MLSYINWIDRASHLILCKHSNQHISQMLKLTFFMWLISKKAREELTSTGAFWIVQCQDAHMRQEPGEWQSVINSMQWCLIKQMRRIRLQTDRLFFSKLLFHLMNINEEVVGGYFIVEDWMQGLSLCLIMPPCLSSCGDGEMFTLTATEPQHHTQHPDTDTGRKDKESERKT